MLNYLIQDNYTKKQFFKYFLLDTIFSHIFAITKNENKIYK